MSYSSVLGLVSRILLTLFFFSLHRLLFCIINFNTYFFIDYQTIIKAFYYGLRFDHATFWILNSLWVLVTILPISKFYEKTREKIVNYTAIVSHGVVCWVNLTDAEYFKFTGKRLTWQQWEAIRHDALQQAHNLALHYWYILLLFISVIWLYAFLFKKITLSPSIKREISLKAKILFFTISLLVITSLAVIGIRGGLQLKPIQMGEAYQLKPPQMGALVLNTPFTLIQSFEKRQSALQPVSWVSQEEINQWKKRPLIGLSSQHKKPTNIVILILESFSAEYVGFMNDDKRYTPFLDSLSQYSIWFPNMYANGRTSIDAVPAILAGVPHLMEEHLIASVYQTVPLGGIGQLLQEKDYKTAFFHGGQNGTMSFDMFTKQIGFTYYGKNEFDKDTPNAENYFDGAWGIYDDAFMKYMLAKINTFSQPFCAVLFTLSSHTPYRIPKKEWFTYPKGTLPIHESIGYVDNALKMFFYEASQTTWYGNTLFIITADHTQETCDEKYSFLPSRYKVPLLLYYPAGFDVVPDTSQVVQHTDIPATICEWLGISSEKLLPFGKSVFLSANQPSISYIHGGYYGFQKNHYIEIRDSNVIVYNMKDIKIEIDSLSISSVQHLKNAIQYHHNGLISGKLSE